ncbi:hypothetical protein [Clostridium amazonitimonense]|uniref:hypothetical protein n=1 Tax=Clostridium amazonitimonense TaxID=1499689 RepID=UPI0005099F66|nr:hypothetical protein [Clostridium amazonitimonense]
MAKQDAKELELFNIEELREKSGLKEAVYQGVKASQGWTSGKMVTETEFQEALKKFLKSPMKG